MASAEHLCKAMRLLVAGLNARDAQKQDRVELATRQEPERSDEAVMT